jgi:hypothetical protein
VGWPTTSESDVALPAAALFAQQPTLTDLALVAAVIGMPLFATVWIIWMLHDMKIRTHREHIA